MRGAAVVGVLLAGAPLAATAQTHVGKVTDGGLHWHVAATEGASWSLDCRFRPITYAVNAYERARWANRFSRRGQGPQAGRLPGDDGRCTLTKTGGAGPVGLALVRENEIASAGADAVGEQAWAGLL